MPLARCLGVEFGSVALRLVPLTWWDLMPFDLLPSDLCLRMDLLPLVRRQHVSRQQSKIMDAADCCGCQSTLLQLHRRGNLPRTKYEAVCLPVSQAFAVSQLRNSTQHSRANAPLPPAGNVVWMIFGSSAQSDSLLNIPAIHSTAVLVPAPNQ